MSSHHQGRMTKASVRREALIIVLFSTTITANYLYMSEFPTGQAHWAPWNLLLLAALSGLILMARMRILPFPRRASTPVLLWMMFALAALGSAILHAAGQAQALWYLLGVPMLFMNMLPLLFRGRGSLIIACSVVLAFLALVGLSLALEPLRFGIPYCGILSNQIHMGQVSAMAVAATLGLLGGALSCGKASRRAAIVLSILLLFALLMAMTTVYRTAVATSLLLVIIFTIANYKRAVRLMRVYAALAVILLALGAGASLSSYGESLRVWEALVEKQQRRTEGPGGGVTSYRDEQARATIANMRLFGYGVDKDPREYLNTTINYHSAYTRVLGQYGIPAALCFIGFWITSIICTRKYIRATRDVDPYNHAPLLLVLFFAIFTLGSQVMPQWLTGPMFPVLTSVGVAVMHDAVQHHQG